MPPVNKLLNVVPGCEIRGRLRCGAASIGYRRRIRKGSIHSPVTPLHGIDVKREIISAALREGRPGDAPAASAGAASGRWPPAECAGSPRLRANFRSFAAPILPALIERRANLAARRFDSPRARDFERAVKPF